MDEREVRMRIVEVMVPKASQVGIMNPQVIIDSCAKLENYVLQSHEGETQPDSPQPKKRGRPRKETTEIPPFLGPSDPTHGG